MNIRRLRLPLAIALAAASPGAFALGLGQLQVKSGLSQPLVAEIPIISASPAELERLDVRLASPEAFARVGLELPVELSQNLQFSLGRNAAGQPVIRITTPNRFTEPFLSFLIQADWGKGSVTREYTALIDPPYIAPAVVRPLLTPSIASAPAPRPQPAEPVVAEPPRPEPEPEPAQPVAIEESAPAPAPEPLPAAPEPEPAPVAAQPAPEPAPIAVQPEPEPEPEPEPVAAPPPAPEPQPVAAAPEPEPEPEPVRPAPEPGPEPVRAAPEPEPVAAAPPAPAPATPSQYGPVAPGQTLFSIASSLRTDPSVSVNQMMLALLRANPDAFAGDNVNELKRGSVLRVPRQDEVTQLTDVEASALVSQQMQAWRSLRAPVPQPEEASAAPEPVAAEPTPVAPTPVAPTPAPAPPRVASSRPRAPASRLEIVPPAGDRRARGGQSGAAAGAGGAELRAELAQAREDLAARNSEINELKSRISDLEQQQNDRQRLVDMQNAQLKELQDRLRAMESGQPAVAGPASTAVSAPITIDAGSDAAASAAATPVAPAQPAPAPANAAPAPAEEQPWYLGTWYIVGAVLLILGGLVLLMRRSKPAAENGEPPGRRLSDDDALRASIAKTREAGARIAAAPDAPVILPAGKPAAAAASPQESALALKALQDAVRERPNDLEAHLSLLRFHHSRGDAEAYQAAAQAMRAQLPTTLDPRWREAVVMGASLLPKTPMFSQAGWNTPRFDGDPAAAAPAPAPVAAAPAPAAPRPATSPAPAAAAPMAARPAPAPAPAPRPAAAAVAAAPAAASAPVRVFEPPAEEKPDEADPNLFGDFGGGGAEAPDAANLGDDEASATRIELAKAYLAIGDLDGARSMLEEVLAEGGAAARSEASRILKEIG